MTKLLPDKIIMSMAASSENAQYISIPNYTGTNNLSMIVLWSEEGSGAQGVPVDLCFYTGTSGHSQFYTGQYNLTRDVWATNPITSTGNINQYYGMSYISKIFPESYGQSGMLGMQVESLATCGFVILFVEGCWIKTNFYELAYSKNSDSMILNNTGILSLLTFPESLILGFTGVSGRWTAASNMPILDFSSTILSTGALVRPSNFLIYEWFAASPKPTGINNVDLFPMHTTKPAPGNTTYFTGIVGVALTEMGQYEARTNF